MEPQDGHSDNRFISIDCDNCGQFAEVLRMIWNDLPSSKLATFNYVGEFSKNILPMRPANLQPNPLSNLGLSVIIENPLKEGILIARSDYRDPCYFLSGEMILAASSDHLLIYANLPRNVIARINLEKNIDNALGAIHDL